MLTDLTPAPFQKPLPGEAPADSVESARAQKAPLSKGTLSMLSLPHSLPFTMSPGPTQLSTPSSGDSRHFKGSPGDGCKFPSNSAFWKDCQAGCTGRRCDSTAISLGKDQLHTLPTA